MRSELIVAPVLAVLMAPGALAAQSFSSLSEEVRTFVRVSEPAVALAHVRVVDGTGGPLL
jgi:hypothetical protein